jgi:hypothetical protein
MKTIAIVVSLAVSLVAAPAAWAQDEASGSFEASGSVEASGSIDASGGAGNHAGPLGLGTNITLGSAYGIDIVYHLDKLTINALLGLAFHSPEDENLDTEIGLAFAAGAFYELHRSGDAAFNLGGRLVYSMFGRGNNQDAASEIDIELPVRLTYDAAPSVSFHLEFGVLIGLGGEDGSIGPAPTDGTWFQIGAGRTFGSVGFDVYF